MNIKSYRQTYSVSFTSISEMIGEIQELKNRFTIVDKKVYEMHQEIISDILTEDIFTVDATENNKTIDTAMSIVERLAELDSRKNIKIIVIGGGITQDISCFTASILYRGVDWYFIPTTLLAQADSCIGSKSSLNMIPYKNILGTFHPPKKVYICTDMLETLSVKEYYSGIGEIAKCALLNGKERFIDFAENLDSVIDRDYSILKNEIEKTLTYKKSLIEIDEFDMGVRNLLNYGHTFGHAVESASDYAIPHGQAVSLGILIANNVSVQRGQISKEYDKLIFAEISKILSMDTIKKEFFDPIKIIQCMRKDKKYSSSHNCILLNAEGAEKYPVSDKEIELALLNVCRSLEIC